MIDTLAPPKEVTLSAHPRQPWFNDAVKAQHKVVRRRECAWLKYKLDLNWIAYNKERNIYNGLLTYSKCQSLSKKINDLRGNTKGLYKLTANLTGITPQNPMPQDKNDAQLAEEFAEFFIDKIDKICQQFHNTVAYMCHATQSWGDRSDTKHSKCLLLGGRRLNQLTLIPKLKGSGGARAATAQVGPANKRNDTKRCLPIEASLRPGEAVPW